MSLNVCLSSTKVCPFIYFMRSLRVSYYVFWSYSTPPPTFPRSKLSHLPTLPVFFFLTLSRPVCVAHYGCVVFHWDYTGENGLSSPWQLTVAISSMVGLYASSPLSSMLGFGLAWTCTGFVHGSATAPDSYTQWALGQVSYRHFFLTLHSAFSDSLHPGQCGSLCWSSSAAKDAS